MGIDKLPPEGTRAKQRTEAPHVKATGRRKEVLRKLATALDTRVRGDVHQQCGVARPCAGPIG